MRVMFTVLPVSSHLMIMAPLASALQSAGHDVRVVTHNHEDTVASITATGLSAVPLGEGIDFLAAVQDTFANEALEGIARATGVDPEDGNLWPMVRNYLVATYAMYYPADPDGPAAPGAAGITEDMVRFAREWQPDLVVWDPLFFASPIAARACGAAHTRLLWGLDRFGWLRSLYTEGRRAAAPDGPDLMAELMRPVLDRFGVEFGEDLITGQWSIDPWPAAMRLPLDLEYVPVRPVPYNGAAVVPEWLHGTPGVPRVCLTLGTSGRELFAENGISISDVFRMVEDLPVELVATLNESQLAGVGTVPDNVRVIDYIPLNLLLPSCSGIIHLGGSGTWAAAVVHGAPQLMVPKNGSEYVDFARYTASRGAGLVIEDEKPTIEALREGLLRILREPSFQEATTILRQEMAEVPSPAAIVPELERLTRLHRAAR